MLQSTILCHKLLCIIFADVCYASPDDVSNALWRLRLADGNDRK